MSDEISLSVYRGATLQFDVAYTDANGDPAPDLNSAVADMRLSENAGGGLVQGTIDAQTGIISFEVAPFLTQIWPDDESGVSFQIWLDYDLATPRKEMILAGTVEVLPSL